ncbi:MAG: hypothetical protein ACEPO8_02065 [Rhodothermaceae bacterium]
MFSDFMSSIDGIGIYPVISLLMFFTVFVGVGVYLFTANKEEMNNMAMMPLDKNFDEKTNERENENE